MQHTDPATLRLLHLLHVRLPGWHERSCSGYANCCDCPDCTERAQAVCEFVEQNPLVDHGIAARMLTTPRKRHAQPWELDAEAA